MENKDMMADFLLVPEEADKKEESNILTQLTALATRQIELEVSVARLTKALDEEKKKLVKIANEEIPTLLNSQGLSRVKLVNGFTIDVKEDINVTINDADKDKLYIYLRDLKDDDIIKSRVLLGKQEVGVTDKIYKFLRENNVEFEHDDSIAPQTLKKYFRLKCGINLDSLEREAKYLTKELTPPSQLPEWCKVFVIKKTKITK